jgi:hypothetical protein
MQKFTKIAAVLGLTVLVTACGAPAQDEVVIVEPVTMDPVSTKF